ncbi:hypothetical protein [Achromobacter xylosoxidans]|uniref:hypothetical protein n=1 Tax=Alcaligenes xylosoxydans xylosoxydans TaxID=85698 RepID=UPI001F143398|nr:hypothetical protein [Achromobacter xylosoxidans]
MSAAPIDNRLTVLVFVILAAVALLLVRSDWLMVGLGPYFPAYWAAVLAWLVCITLAIRRQRRWWLLLTAPVVLYPAVRVAAFLVECSQKACIF